MCTLVLNCIQIFLEKIATLKTNMKLSFCNVNELKQWYYFLSFVKPFFRIFKTGKHSQVILLVPSVVVNCVLGQRQKNNGTHQQVIKMLKNQECCSCAGWNVHFAPCIHNEVSFFIALCRFFGKLVNHCERDADDITLSCPLLWLYLSS